MYIDLERELTDWDLWMRRERALWARGKPPGAEQCDVIIAGGYQCPAVAVGVDPRSGKRSCLGQLWAADHEN